MSAAGRFKVAPWDEPELLMNRAGNSLFKAAQLDWSRPKRWMKGEPAPLEGLDGPHLYALIRNHGNSTRKDRIEYIGLTKAVARRFGNHPTANRIVNKRGQVGLSVAPINFIQGRNRIANEKRALEEIEHLLIWALAPRENDRKTSTLPGMGVQRGNAWHITNTGYRFAGGMPQEIVYPWMLIRPGRDRTLKGSSST